VTPEFNIELYFWILVVRSETPKKFLYRHIGQILRALRMENGLTQAEAAALIGKSHQTYSNYEKADNLITLDSLYILAMHYQVPVQAFLPDHQLVLGHAASDSSLRPEAHFSESAEPFDSAELTAHSLAHAEEMQGLFMMIKNQAMRESLLELVRTIVSSAD